MSQPNIRILLEFAISDMMKVRIYDEYDGEPWVQYIFPGGDYQDPFNIDQFLLEIGPKIAEYVDEKMTPENEGDAE